MHFQPIESEEVKMGKMFQLKGYIYEVKFGYHSKMGGYMTLMSDIPELYEIAPNK